MDVSELSTPAAVIDAAGLAKNLVTMAAARPGPALRPHVKAHKCTSLARRQAGVGHTTFTCATAKEAYGIVRAGISTDVLVANEILDRKRLEALAGLADHGTVTVAVDSDDTIEAAATAGITSCLVDVNVGLKRCGVAPDDAGRLAETARRRGLTVRGVMGYEGHLMALADRTEQRQRVADSMGLLVAAAADAGGEIISAGGAGRRNDPPGSRELRSSARIPTGLGRMLVITGSANRAKGQDPAGPDRLGRQRCARGAVNSRWNRSRTDCGSRPACLGPHGPTSTVATSASPVRAPKSSSRSSALWAILADRSPRPRRPGRRPARRP